MVVLAQALVSHPEVPARRRALARARAGGRQAPRADVGGRRRLRRRSPPDRAVRPCRARPGQDRLRARRRPDPLPRDGAGADRQAGPPPLGLPAAGASRTRAAGRRLTGSEEVADRVDGGAGLVEEEVRDAREDVVSAPRDVRRPGGGLGGRNEPVIRHPRGAESASSAGAASGRASASWVRPWSTLCADARLRARARRGTPASAASAARRRSTDDR